eukprot:365386-Chlamydomonas_euryale.AAC.6
MHTHMQDNEPIEEVAYGVRFAGVLPPNSRVGLHWDVDTARKELVIRPSSSCHWRHVGRWREEGQRRGSALGERAGGTQASRWREHTGGEREGGKGRRRGGGGTQCVRVAYVAALSCHEGGRRKGQRKGGPRAGM